METIKLIWLGLKTIIKTSVPFLLFAVAYIGSIWVSYKWLGTDVLGKVFLILTAIIFVAYIVGDYKNGQKDKEDT